jgi:hypothetical protein
VVLPQQLGNSDQRLLRPHIFRWIVAGGDLTWNVGKDFPSTVIDAKDPWSPLIANAFKVVKKQMYGGSPWACRAPDRISHANNGGETSAMKRYLLIGSYVWTTTQYLPRSHVVTWTSPATLSPKPIPLRTSCFDMPRPQEQDQTP